MFERRCLVSCEDNPISKKPVFVERTDVNLVCDRELWNVFKKRKYKICNNIYYGVNVSNSFTYL